MNLNKQTRLLVQVRLYATIAKCHKTQQSLSHSDQTKAKTPQTGLHEPWNAGNLAAGTPALILNGSLVATYPKQEARQQNIVQNLRKHTNQELQAIKSNGTLPYIAGGPLKKTR